MNFKSKAFTLVEMCISLIVITSLLAALTPLISKNLTKKNKTNANQLKYQCEQFNVNDPITHEEKKACSLCYPDLCVQCDLPKIPKYAVVTSLCDYKACSELFPGCTGNCDETKCLVAEDTAPDSSETNPTPGSSTDNTEDPNQKDNYIMTCRMFPLGAKQKLKGRCKIDTDGHMICCPPLLAASSVLDCTYNGKTVYAYENNFNGTNRCGFVATDYLPKK